MNKRPFLLAVILCLVVLLGNAAPLKNVQRVVVQPNGEKLVCYVSGDEFYNRLHDAKGYTIVQDEKTGYYVYACQDVKGNLTATSLVAGVADPETFGLVPNLIISQAAYLKKRDAMLKHVKPIENKKKDRELNHGDYNNIVIYIRFAGDDELHTTASQIDSMFNGPKSDDISMYNYFHHASYNQIKIRSYSYPKPDGEQLVSYEDIHPREYYLPYNAASNPQGYQEWERAEREFDLLERACEYVADMVPDTLNIDYNDDGNVDNVVFVVKGNVSDWSSLLWPHRWSLYGRDAFINGKRVMDFNFQLETSSYFTTTTLCHEMSHSLGSPDLYHYNTTSFTPVGGWDLMCNSAGIPQHLGVFMKQKYGNWVDEIPLISEYGTYELESDGWEGGRRNAYRIPSSNPNQYYVLEYRNRSNFFDVMLPGSGILIYRIDTRYSGCAGYNGYDTYDEVYIFRPGGSQHADGFINSAHFSSEQERTAFNKDTDPSPFFTGGTIDNQFNISNISCVGDRMSFTYCPMNDAVIPENLVANVIAGVGVHLTWNAIPTASEYKIYRDGALIADNVTENTFQDAYANLSHGYHYYQVVSVCNGETSIFSEKGDVIIGDYCKFDIVMTDNGNDGWEGGEIRVNFDNEQEMQYLTLYSGSERVKSFIVPKGTTVALDWLAGWEDSECSFTVRYADGDVIFSSETLSEGELTRFVCDGDFNPCVAPENLTSHLDGFTVVLNWSSPVESEGFGVFRDGQLIASVNESTYRDESLANSGTHRYVVRSQSSNCESDFSNEVYATVMNYFCSDISDLTATEVNDTVTLAWKHDFGGLLCYDNDTYIESIGASSMNWAIKIMPEQLAAFGGTRLRKIEMYDAAAGQFTFKIYNGENVENGTLIHTESYQMTGTGEWVQVALSEAVPFDASLPVWVTVKSSGANKPGPCCKYSGDPNSCLIKTGGKWYPITMYGMDYSWLLRLYTDFPDTAASVKYRIYRNGTVLVDACDSSSYLDHDLVSGNYCYKVALLRDGAEVGFTNEACITYGLGVGDEDVARQVVLYPNPASDKVTLLCKNMKEVRVVNASGSVVLAQNVAGDNVIVNLADLPSGLYLVCITTDTGLVTKTISIVR